MNMLFSKFRFYKNIFRFHNESFPDLDLNREDLRKMLKNGNGLGIQTFRGNVSKINKKIKNKLQNETLFNNFAITIEGSRGSKFYGVRCENSKIRIYK